MQAPENKRPISLPDGFRDIKLLGNGQYGSVYLCEYTGKDENIIKLLDSKNRVAVKMQNVPDLNEGEIGKMLYKKAMQTPDQQPRFNLVLPVIKEGNQQGLASQYITYDDSDSKSDLVSFIRDMYDKNSKQSTEKLVQDFNSDSTTFLSQLATSAHQAVSQINGHNVLHYDIAARNLLVTKPQYDEKGNLISLGVILCDYGLSQSSDEKTVRYLNENKQAPIEWCDWNQALRQATVASELYALKATIMTMVGLELGAEHEKDVLGTGEQKVTEIQQGHYKHFNWEKMFDNKDFMTKRFENGEYFANDNGLLKQYFSNIKLLTSQCNDLKKKAEMTLFVNCYENYLTSIVPSNLSSKEAHEKDRDLFLKANEKFIGLRIEMELKNINPGEEENSQELHLLVKRLLAVDVSDEFKLSQRYQEMIALSVPPELRAQQNIVQKNELLSYLTNLEHDLKRQIPYYQQAVDGEVNSNPKMLAVRNLFDTIEGIKTEINQGAIDNKDTINNIVNPLVAAIIQPETPRSSISERARLSQSPSSEQIQQESENTSKIGFRPG